MPGVTQYIVDPNSRTNAHRIQEDAVRYELDARVKRIKHNWDYYEGRHKKHLADDGTNTDDNVIVNLYGLVVDKGVADTVAPNDDGVVSGPKFDVAGDEIPKPRIVRTNGQITREKPAKSPEQEWLDLFWELNNKELFLLNLSTSSAVTGHNFVKIMPDEKVNPNDEAQMLPRLVWLNPAHVTVFWDEGDKEKVLAYRIQYGKDGYAKRQDVVRESVTADNGDGMVTESGEWIIYDFEQVQGRRTWQLINRQTWGYQWPPIVQWPNLPDPNGFYGKPDVDDANRGLNDSVNFVNSNIQRIIKYHADPKTVATGAKATDDLVAQAANRMIAIENDDAKVYTVEMQSDLSSSMNFAKNMRRAFFDGTRELDPATVEDRLGDLTNFGLRVLFGDKVKKAGSKRLMCGMGLTDICQRALELGEYGSNRKVAIKWPEILADDSLVESQSLDMDTKHGLSQESYLQERGYDVELEAERRAREAAVGMVADMTKQQAALVDKVRANGRVQQPTQNGAIV